ncbi:MAG: hypothetical protein EOS41_23545 [Mesorhizobium sp.]|uniref:IS66 family insertion sequence element accessory protein TnpB n=1 Tax=Mesorhizobium sp. TaxID=1871066 RepID=UPI000FEA4215|nr:IS66 family insertion sequence element accessory protein TnpB [Mesorhizobium sp.]RWE22859.1 MAG: hypothetical protein EOS41_23545 [Mesorhizobium sp.]
MIRRLESASGTGHTDIRKGLDGLASLFTKRMEHGQFMWPRLAEPGGSVTLSPTQLAMLIEGIDGRAPERFWGPSPCFAVR